jgi:hypothetical protein
VSIVSDNVIQRKYGVLKSDSGDSGAASLGECLPSSIYIHYIYRPIALLDIH